MESFSFCDNLPYSDELVDTRKKYNEARENYHRTVQEKFEIERMNEEFMERVKIQLTDKTREFEQLRDKFAPQDIDFIRIKLQEELEIPHKHRIQSMQNEVEAARQQQFSVKRELDRCRAEFDAYVNNQKIEAAAIISEKEEIIASLRAELDKFRAKENSLEKDDTIRSQRLRLQESHQTHDSLLEDVRTITKERDNLLLLLAETKSKTEELVASYRSRVATAEADRLAVEQRVMTLTSEIDRKEAMNHQLRDKFEEVGNLHESTLTKLADAEARVAELRSELSEVQLTSKMQHHKDMQDLTAETERLMSRLSDREELLRRAQREMSDMQTRAEAQYNETRRAHSQQLQELHSRIQALTKDAEELHKAQASKDFKQHQAYEALAIEAETLRSELIPLRKEKELLHTRILELESSLDTERRQNIQARRDQSTATFSQQAALSTANDKIRELEAQLKRVKQAESDHLAQIIQLKAQVERASVDSSRLVSQSQRETQEKIARLESQYLLKTEEVRQSYNTLLAKEKKKSQAYKEKAIDAHRREKLISETALAAAMYGPAAADLPGGLGQQQFYPSMQEVFGDNWAATVAGVVGAGAGTGIPTGSV